MCPNKDWFIANEEVLRVIVIMRNNALCKIFEVDTIRIRMFDGVIRTLIDVRHVPELKQNLISLSTFDAKVYRYTIKGGVLKMVLLS